jgi:hypothetical protein
MNGARTRGLLPLTFVLFGLLFGSSTFAHSIPVFLTVKTNGEKLEMQMFSREGLPIQSAKVAYILKDEKGRTFKQTFSEEGLGLYSAANPKTKAGPYSFVVRDTTFPEETLEVKAAISWPLTKPLSMMLPASKSGAPNPFAVGLFLAAPVLLSGVVLLVVIMLQKRRTHSEAPTNPES